MDLAEAFNRHHAEFLKFERIEKPRHPRPDLCAFLLLHELVPGSRDMVSSAAHDEIWLDVDCDALGAVISDEQVIELTRCGVRIDSESVSLAMFV